MPVVAKPQLQRSATVAILWLVLVLAFESLAVSTVMPVASAELNAGDLYGAVFASYLITSLFGTVVAGEACDRGYLLYVLIAGFLFFTAGLLLAGAAPGAAAIVVARLLQGFGGGLVPVAMYVVVARTYSEDRRLWMFSAMTTAWVIPALIGPSIAGVVAEHLGWRWVFLAVPPLVVPAAILVLRQAWLVRSSGSAAQPGPVRWYLALLVAVGVALLEYASHLNTSIVIVIIMAAVIFLGIGLPRLLPPGTLTLRRGLPSVLVIRSLVGGAFVAGTVYVPLLLVDSRGVRASLAGLALTGASLSWTSTAWARNRFAPSASPTAVIRMGCGMLGIGALGALLCLFVPHPLGVMVVCWAIAGAGMGLAYPTVKLLVMNLASSDGQGRATASSQIAESLGGIVLVGLSGYLLAELGGRGQHAPFIAIFGLILVAGVAAALLVRRITG
jgi:MFS family permease